jgi:acyl-CoA thioesterase-1
MRFVLLMLIFCFPVSATAEDKMVLILGDSISAGYGLDLEEGWVHLLRLRLRDLGQHHGRHNARGERQITKITRTNPTRP